MVRRQDREFGDGARRIEADIDRELVAGVLAGAYEARVAYLARQLDLEPVGRIMPADIGVELGLRPFGEGDAEFGLRRRDALGAIDLGEAAGQRRLGLVVERAKKLRLQDVPGDRAVASNDGGGM